MAGLLAAFLIAVPLAALAAAQWSHAAGLRVEHAQETAWHQIPAVLLIPRAVAILLLGTGMIAHRMLQRQRLESWDADWRMTAPQWTSRRWGRTSGAGEFRTMVPGPGPDAPEAGRVSNATLRTGAFWLEAAKRIRTARRMAFQRNGYRPGE